MSVRLGSSSRCRWRRRPLGWLDRVPSAGTATAIRRHRRGTAGPPSGQNDPVEAGSERRQFSRRGRVHLVDDYRKDVVSCLGQCTRQLRTPVSAAGKDKGPRLVVLLDQLPGKVRSGAGPYQLDPETRDLSAGRGAGTDGGDRKLQQCVGAKAFALSDETFGSARGRHDEPCALPEIRQAIRHRAPAVVVVHIGKTQYRVGPQLEVAGIEKRLQLAALGWVTRDEDEAAHAPTTSGIANRRASKQTRAADSGSRARLPTRETVARVTSSSISPRTARSRMPVSSSLARQPRGR